MPRFTSGVVRFQKEIFPQKKELFERLSRGQTPEALFITCSDSRIETSMITQSAPGDLFVCRNAGNIVPPHTPHTGGMTASIEFAVSILRVPHIVICGHSNCGALHGALHPETLEGHGHIREWLAHADKAVATVKTAGASLTEEQKLTMIKEQNVILQLEHLKTHPCVRDRLEDGDLTLHGWVYNIKSGLVRAYDQENDCYTPVTQFYQNR